MPISSIRQGKERWPEISAMHAPPVGAPTLDLSPSIVVLTLPTRLNSCAQRTSQVPNCVLFPPGSGSDPNTCQVPLGPRTDQLSVLQSAGSENQRNRRPSPASD